MKTPIPTFMLALSLTLTVGSIDTFASVVEGSDPENSRPPEVSSGAAVPVPRAYAVDPVPEAPTFQPPKSYAAAYALMLAGTVIPVVAAAVVDGEGTAFLLGAGGVLIGPSVGQFYAGSPATGLLGIGLRTLGSVLVFKALLECFGSDDCDDGSAAVGSLLFIGGTGFSVVETAFAVNRANTKARKRAYRASLSPAVIRLANGHTAPRWAPGLAFNASF